jgi:hypothetical protein
MWYTSNLGWGYTCGRWPWRAVNYASEKKKWQASPEDEDRSVTCTDDGRLHWPTGQRHQIDPTCKDFRSTLAYEKAILWRWMRGHHQDHGAARCKMPSLAAHDLHGRTFSKTNVQMVGSNVIICNNQRRKLVKHLERQETQSTNIYIDKHRNRGGQAS